MREISGACVFQGDIRERDNVEKIVSECDADWIIHLAAFLSEDCEREPGVAIEVNALNLHRVAVAYGIRHFILASNIVLDGPRNIVFKNDIAPIGPASLYDKTIKTWHSLLCARLGATRARYVALCNGGLQVWWRGSRQWDVSPATSAKTNHVGAQSDPRRRKWR